MGKELNFSDYSKEITGRLFYRSKTTKEFIVSYEIWRNKDQLICGVLLWTPTYEHSIFGQPEKKKEKKTYFNQLSEMRVSEKLNRKSS